MRRWFCKRVFSKYLNSEPKRMKENVQKLKGECYKYKYWCRLVL